MNQLLIWSWTDGYLKRPLRLIEFKSAPEISDRKMWNISNILRSNQKATCIKPTDYNHQICNFQLKKLQFLTTLLTEVWGNIIYFIFCIFAMIVTWHTWSLIPVLVQLVQPFILGHSSRTVWGNTGNPFSFLSKQTCHQ